MAEISWPKKLRKVKPYTAEELLSANCLTAARAIMKANPGQGEILEVLPPEGAIRLGPVYPPSGGKITDWFDHRVVKIAGRFYDCMTGPSGMTEQEYRALFQEGDILVFKRAEEQ
jgi:hypothetical protein